MITQDGKDAGRTTYGFFPDVQNGYNTLWITGLWEMLWGLWCGVVVCNADNGNPVTFKWKRSEDELPISDQYAYLGVEMSKKCAWDAHIANVIGTGEAHVGKVDAISTDLRLDARINICSMMNMTVPTIYLIICRRRMGREREVGKTAGNSAVLRV